ncbi:YkgJ family cysteine cluster protein [uncultured Veillonella sp.]|mgnify:FL=1|uniref:YkgJ family cysteine cluster protein n=1 Tax=uncultured Veillonella sp. TaxID=159268 RepID=UPI0037DD93CD
MFSCDKCGLCCRNIDRIPELKTFHNGNGICKFLINNKCSIYDRRPLICNVDRIYEKFFRTSYTLEEFYKLNHQVCMMLKQHKL